jgi:hypothetical protein
MRTRATTAAVIPRRSFGMSMRSIVDPPSLACEERAEKLLDVVVFHGGPGYLLSGAATARGGEAETTPAMVAHSFPQSLTP